MASDTGFDPFSGTNSNFTMGVGMGSGGGGGMFGGGGTTSYGYGKPINVGYTYAGPNDGFNSFMPGQSDPTDGTDPYIRLIQTVTGALGGGVNNDGSGGGFHTIGGLGGITTGQGSNQYGSYPTIGSGGMSNMGGAGTPGTTQIPGQQTTPGFNSSGMTGNNYLKNLSDQWSSGSTLAPGLTQDFFTFLSSQLGKGVAPYSGTATLPSSGATTGAGSLTAPNNQMLQQLFQAFTTGNYSGVGGLDTLSSMSKTGNPIDQTPAWQAMVDAMQRTIGQGRANLKEQFNVGGGLVGSPYGTAATDYESQTAKDLNAQLLGAQTTASENAAGRQLTASQSLSGMNEQLGALFQGLDQSSIDRLMQEFIRTSPEQNPLLNAMYGASTTFPPYLANQQGLGGVGAVLANLGPILQSLQGIGGNNSGGGSSSDAISQLLQSFCWISRAIYGEDSPKVPLIRRFLIRYAAKDATLNGMRMLKWYLTNGPVIAAMIKLDSKIGDLFRPMFDDFYALGKAEVV